MSADRKRIFFERRSEYSDQIADIEQNERVRELLDGTLATGIDFYLSQNGFLQYCRNHPKECFGVSRQLEDLLPSVVKFIDLRQEFLKDLREEGLLDLERKYFGPSGGSVFAGDSEGAPAYIEGGPGGDTRGRGGISLPGGVGQDGSDGVTVTLTDDWPLDTSVNDLDDLLDRNDGIDIHIGRFTDPTDVGPGDTDPSFEKIRKFLEWWEKHMNDPDFKVSAHLTVRRSTENDD